jgi:hypothetical protein
VYRAGYGIFYDRSGARPISEAKRFNGEIIRSITILNSTYGRPIPPGQTIATLPTDLTTFAPNISLPLLNFFSLGVDRQIGKGATISIPYRGNINLNLFRSLDVNAPLYPWSSSLRPDPSFGFVRQIQSRGHQFSNALDFTFRGSISHWFSGLAQYTLGRTWNNSGGIAWFPANQYDDTGEYTRADFDQLHRLNIPGTINEGHSASLGVAANLNWKPLHRDFRRRHFTDWLAQSAACRRSPKFAAGERLRQFGPTLVA